MVQYSQTENAGKSTVRLTFKSLDQLLDLDDPSPYPHKELTEIAEDAIANHVGDIPFKKEVDLVVSLPSGTLNHEIKENLPEAIRQHFAFRASEKALEVVRKKRRLKAGLKFTVALIVLMSIAGGVINLIPESDRFVHVLIAGIFTILAWAAIWDTAEAYALDYRALVGNMKVYEKISRMNMRIE